MLTVNRLFASSCRLLGVTSKRHYSRYTSIKGYWPEPLTQQTLQQFLDDIDYFERPRELINIGLRLDKPKGNQEKTPDEARATAGSLGEIESVNVDNILDMLGEDIALPELDLDDITVSREQLKDLAIDHGIYRDLFSDYQPNRDQIKFTPEQAERLAKLVPHYWISEQPRARADRHLKRTDPLVYFEPIVRVSARFVHTIEGEEAGQYAHTAHHGNIIPASEALIKPSITLDCSELPQPGKTTADRITDSHFNNWIPGQISCENFISQSSSPYYSLLLLNLDYLHPNSANLHWMASNFRPSDSGAKELPYDEICDYMPVHGIRGFGYSRYVFLVLQHDSKIDSKNIDLESRQFDTTSFIGSNKGINMVPVGLSWFQTTWDTSSNKVFHEHLKMRSPVYELVQEKYAKRKMLDMAYPGKIPFNLFMDHNKDKKEINERVLLERLKTIDPFDYKDQYVKPKVPETIFADENIPSWMTTVMFKKRNKVGYYRGLRPASVTLPLNNNADLDQPMRPIVSAKKSLPSHPNLYEGRHRTKALKDLPHGKPANEQPAVYIQEDHEVHLDQVREMMKDLKKKAANK